MTLQAGWEDRVDFGLDLYQDIPVGPRRIPTPTGPPRVLTPVDLNEIELETNTDVCRAGHIQHERPVAFHEFIPEDLSSSSNTEDCIVHELHPIEQDSDLDSMPELEDEVNVDALGIPSWLIPSGVIITFRGGWAIFEREQGPPWQEVLTQMLAEQNLITDNN